MNKKTLIVSLVVIVAVLGAFYFIPQEEPLFSGSAWKRNAAVTGDGTSYQVIYSGAGTLERIIVGATHTNGTMVVYDGSSSSDATTKINFKEGITEGVIDVGLDFDIGILTTVSSQLSPVFIY